MFNFSLYLFGEPHILYQEQRLNMDRRKALALLAYLALSEHRQNRDLVAALLWPDLDQKRARAALRSTLSALAVQAPGDWLSKDRTTLALNSDALWIDVTEFLALLRRSRSHRHDNNALCETCAGWLRDAVDLYQADFMSGFSLADSAEFDAWQTTQRERLHRELSYVLRRLATYYGEREDFDAALLYANRWLTLDPLDEPAHRMLMRLYAASGQRTAALRQYQQCVEILDSELATHPEEETHQLYRAISTESTLPFARTSPSSTQPINLLPPMPALVVGRDHALQEIKTHLGIGGEMRPITVLQGWPGIGKSTLVAALAHDADVARAFPDGVLWASLGETPRLLRELTVWAETLGLLDAGSQPNLDMITAQLTAALRDRRMLLLVDDVWQVEHAAPFKVGGQGCAMLLTSRLNDVAQALAPTAYDFYHLDVLSEAAALELMQRLTPETMRDYPNEARELVRDLEGLPLAIQVAGRLLHTESRLGWGANNLLQELRAGAALLHAQAPSDMATASQKASPTIAALLKRSTDALDEAMRKRFAMLGFFVPKPANFDLGAMAAAWETDDPKPYARILVNRGLLEPVSGGRFQIHALLVLHARSLLEEIQM